MLRLAKHWLPCSLLPVLRWVRVFKVGWVAVAVRLLGMIPLCLVDTNRGRVAVEWVRILLPVGCRVAVVVAVSVVEVEVIHSPLVDPVEALGKAGRFKASEFFKP
jgi:hypothetical protein